MNAISSRSIARWTVLATAVALTAACEPTPTPAGSRPVSSAPSISAPTSAAQSRTASSPAAAIPGRLYYLEHERLVRVTGPDVKTVLEKDAYAANVSPDGAHIAFIDGSPIEAGNVVVADRDGRNRRTVFRGADRAGFEPAWSPDSKRLLIAKNRGPGLRTVGVLTIATGRFTPWERQSLGQGFLWTADGKHVGYVDGYRLVLADPDGRNARVVPVFGSDDRRLNPQRRRSSDTYSISANGRLISVWQRTNDEDSSDIARDLIADAIVDTRTGENVGVPVRGEIRAILFQPNGDILVRTNGKLTLFGPNWKVKAEVAEPAEVKDFELLTYRSN
ncbi:hypothetical protein Ais01nite_84670 [Asanoa ishikariensis]|uniref:TolB protein n=1 Tax=Asanoa ishikariensis TaxID=137265 RepID=A0A1H3KB59_9ACTN|nr:PD40 domain-containing protein [Asanoa ishikariensis]GIF70432.1 hypothetical protein Ais01nite_84670 [Asanoa ishikariensis]SDY49391.1 TolB protein [Asanoa ishikariensis]